MSWLAGRRFWGVVLGWHSFRHGARPFEFGVASRRCFSTFVYKKPVSSPLHLAPNSRTLLPSHSNSNSFLPAWPARRPVCLTSVSVSALPPCPAHQLNLCRSQSSSSILVSHDPTRLLLNRDLTEPDVTIAAQPLLNSVLNKDTLDNG